VSTFLVTSLFSASFFARMSGKLAIDDLGPKDEAFPFSAERSLPGVLEFQFFE
jgi:hypothetical protein